MIINMKKRSNLLSKAFIKPNNNVKHFLKILFKIKEHLEKIMNFTLPNKQK
jgi:hypothetical protein